MNKNILNNTTMTQGNIMAGGVLQCLQNSTNELVERTIEFYADPYTYTKYDGEPSPYEEDRGDRAHQAMECVRDLTREQFRILAYYGYERGNDFGELARDYQRGE